MNAGSEQAQEYAPYLESAVEAARIAGDIATYYFRRSLHIEYKADSSELTIADREAEAKMRAYLSARHPHTRIVGEEAGTSGPEHAEYEWVLDPIDGTRSFVHGIPLYTSLVALVHTGSHPKESILGVIYNPESKDLVSAVRGSRAQCNGAPCHLSSCEDLSQARLICTDPSTYYQAGMPKNAANIDRLFRAVRYTRGWGDAYGYLLLVTGRADIMLDPIMNYWDIAPLIPIVRSAGGIISDFHGNAAMGTSAIASNANVHKQVLNILAE